MVEYIALKDVQSAMLTVMTADTTLMTTRGLTGIFDQAPADQSYNYISFGTKTQIPWQNRTFQKHEWDVTVILDIWTSLEGGDIHMYIADDIGRLFDEPRDSNGNPIYLPLTGYTNVRSLLELVTTMIDEDKITRHTICRVRTINA